MSFVTLSIAWKRTATVGNVPKPQLIKGRTFSESLICAPISESNQRGGPLIIIRHQEDSRATVGVLVGEHVECCPTDSENKDRIDRERLGRFFFLIP